MVQIESLLKELRALQIIVHGLGGIRNIGAGSGNRLYVTRSVTVDMADQSTMPSQRDVGREEEASMSTAGSKSLLHDVMAVMKIHFEQFW